LSLADKEIHELATREDQRLVCKVELARAKELEESARSVMSNVLLEGAERSVRALGLYDEAAEVLSAFIGKVRRYKPEQQAKRVALFPGGKEKERDVNGDIEFIGRQSERAVAMLHKLMDTKNKLMEHPLNSPGTTFIGKQNNAQFNGVTPDGAKQALAEFADNGD
jgi:hypothetical protein